MMMRPGSHQRIEIVLRFYWVPEIDALPGSGALERPYFPEKGEAVRLGIGGRREVQGLDRLVPFPVSRIGTFEAYAETASWPCGSA